MGVTDRWELADRRLYLCSPDRDDLEQFIASCISGGVDVVQLREKHLPDDQLVKRAGQVQRICADHGVPFILNDRPDLAIAAGADGVHVGQEDMPSPAARELMGDGAIIGLSTHGPDDLANALGTGPMPSGRADQHPLVPVDYVSAGPVVPTPTKPGRPGTGIGYVTEAVRQSPWPVWITGGVDPGTVTGLITAGARHFVVVRWLTESADPETSARSLRRIIDEAIDSTG